MFSVTKLWELMSGNDELGPALSFLARAGRRFGGNTHTHEHLQEVCIDGVPTLEVYYQGAGTVRYRRPSPDTGGCGMEFMTSCLDPEWAPVAYDPGQDTLLSPALLHHDGSHAALPNKVVHWLRGVPMPRLVTIKTNHEPTARFRELRETTSGWLEVTFEQQGALWYRRGDRTSIGFEQGPLPGAPALPLGHSESMKSLTGPRGGVLPNQVTTWLLGTALSQIASFPPRPAASPED